MSRSSSWILSAALLAVSLASPAGTQDGRASVAAQRAITSAELQALEAQVRALIAPIALETLSKPADAAGTTSGGAATAQRSVTRADGVSVTILSAQQGNMPPTNVGVWHGSREQSGFAALLSGDVGRLVLRMNDPDAGADVLPFGFRCVRLFNEGHEKEYRFEDGRWMLTEYDGAGT